MSFTLTNAKSLADSWINESIDNGDLLLWGNECLRFAIGSKGWQYKAEYFNAGQGIWYNLPTDFISIVVVHETIGAPDNLAVTVEGAAGETTYGYRVTSLNGTGESIACTEVQVTTGNATLSESNYNELTWDEVDGATGYNVYRTTNEADSDDIGLIATITDNALNDTGLSGDGGTVPFEDTTGDEYTGYTIRSRKIKFTNAGQYVLTYIAHPADLSAITDALPLPDVFLYAFAKYLASRQKGKRPFDKQDRDEAEQYMGEFYAALNQISGEVDITNQDYIEVKEHW